MIRLGAVALGLALAASAAQADSKLKIGILNDQSGPLADLTGASSVLAVRMAIEDFRPEAHGLQVEVISADHQNKPDIGSNITRGWFDNDAVDVVMDVPNSSVALAVNTLVAERNKVVIFGGAGSSDLTGSQCTPNTVHWTYDTWGQAHAIAESLVKAGDTSWFFLTADYAFGHALERDSAEVVKANGGSVIGVARYPSPAADFSSYLLRAQSSGAKAVALANTGADTITSVKQAQEFGIPQSGQKVVTMLITLGDVHAIGLATAAGIIATEPWYWDQDEASRAFAKRYAARFNGRYPASGQAGMYSATIHYLKAAAAMKADSVHDGRAVVAKMREIPIDDVLYGRGEVRADGRATHAMYVYQVKSPAESKGPFDYFKTLSRIPPEDAFRRLSESACKLVKR
jgi:branched-chain amino acid transport system substrate-binding protein